MSDQSELLAAIATMMDEKIAAALPSEPVATTKPTPAKASGTVAKAATIKRQLDPVTVDATERVTFKVLAHSDAGAMFTKGARVVGEVDGKRYRSLDEETIIALAEDGVLDKLTAAIATVNKRALLGSHAPKVAAAS